MCYNTATKPESIPKRKRMKKSYLLLAAAVVLLSGCNKLTKENYDKIKSGMHYDQVVQILGKPANCSEAIGLTSCKWKQGESEVNINFISNKVTIITGDNLK
jgi:hypothetical protein